MINIEICKSEYAKGKWRIRTGSIEGATELSNISMTEVLELVREEMREELQELEKK